MADIQHRNISDLEAHEPKNISTATNKQVYLANGSASGTWRRITEDDIAFTDNTKNKFGWNYRADTQYTSGAPLSVTSGVKTLLTNNGLGTLSNTTRPLNITYDSNGFTPTTLNSSYILRVGLKLKAAAAAGTPYVCKITLEGGATPLTFAAQDFFVKGGSYENAISQAFFFWTGSLNTNNPIKIYVTPDTNITVYDIDYIIQRTYLEV